MGTARFGLAEGVSCIRTAAPAYGWSGRWTAPLALKQALPRPEAYAHLRIDRSTRDLLENIRTGQPVDQTAAFRGLALLAARAGLYEARELAPKDEAGPRFSAVLPELLAPLSFGPTPEEGFMATMADPASGFSPFRTELGTKVAFFRTADSLGRWGEMVKPKWANGLGLIAFWNDRAQAGGFIFVHALAKVGWSVHGQEAWQTSGGTMAYADNAIAFGTGLVRVVDKGRAMTFKWPVCDVLLEAIEHDKRLGLAGSKGIFVHAPGGDETKARGADVYAEVIHLLGITLTGSDEGVQPRWADYLAERAPYNIYGSRRSAYEGRVPTGHTGHGVFRGIEAIFEETGQEAPVLIQGAGGTGTSLLTYLESRPYRVAGVIDTDHDKLSAVKRIRPGVRLFLDTKGRPLERERIAAYQSEGIVPVSDIAAALDAAPETKILAPCATTHTVTFDLVVRMIERGAVTALAGSANNPLATDRNGSEEAMAWILMAAGKFAAADFAINANGALAVSSGVSEVSDGEMDKLAYAIGDRVAEEISDHRSGVPPWVAETQFAARQWKARVDAGLGIGGVMPEYL